MTIQSTALDISFAKYAEVTPSPGLNRTSWRMNARYGATRPTSCAPRSRAVAATSATVMNCSAGAGYRLPTRITRSPATSGGSRT